ncbi:MULTISPECIES: PepSY-like domain-containing protein [unclassified Flavobacterium]|uniref:PepSY-like domain-containing protein n=1 Tax=unclassified Flavobacterium TaxID=196869 RepID=UPI003F90FBBC
MKNLAVLSIALLVTSLTFAQKTSEKEIPPVVKAAFQKHYPTIKKAKWDKEQDKFEASFDLNKTDNSVLFDKQGNILETEAEIKTSQLPKTVLDYVKIHYKDASIKEAAKITNHNGQLTYEVEIKKMDILFDQNGKFIKEIKN